MHKEVLFLGDVYLPRSYPGIEKMEYAYVFNLEYPITRSSNALPGKINLKSDACYVKQTFGRVPLAVCLANNHIVDYGDEGITDTFSALENEGIAYFGAGKKEDNYNNPLILEQYGVALLGYCGISDVQRMDELGLDRRPAPLKLDLIKTDIESALRKNYRPIVQLHWGVEESAWPTRENVEFARQLVEFGAEMVLSHHAHTIQPVEYYKGKLIAYGLGNYLFDDVVAPRQFDNKGNPQSYFKRIQERWNRRSIGVLVDMADFSVSVKGFEFRNGLIHKRDKSGVLEAVPAQLDDAEILAKKIRKSVDGRFLFRKLRKISENPPYYIYRGVLKLMNAVKLR